MFRRLLVSAALGALALPGFAHAYDGYSGYHSSACDDVRQGRQGAGATIGGLVGGLIGNGVAADNAKHEGAAVGALIGAVIGAGIGEDSAECSDYSQPYGYSTAGFGYEEPVARPYTPEPYAEPRYSEPRYGRYSQPEPAARECETVKQVTHLPDGREIHEPVKVCREAYYGDWDVRR